MTSNRFSRRGMLAILGVQSALLPAGALPGGNSSISSTDGERANHAYPRTPEETRAAIVPANFGYPPGSPRRYGAVGDGITDDTAALTACICCNQAFVGHEGDIYGVSTVVFPADAPRIVRFNGARIRGIAKGAANSIAAAVVIRCNFTSFYDYWVDLVGIGGGPSPNPTYTCATWWSNATGTQFNVMYGCLHQICRRAMVYGALPGQKAVSTIQSENVIHGWRTTGVSNPFFQNSIQGFIHFVAPTFFRDSSGWTKPELPVTARAIENEVGALLIQGGEIIFSNSRVGFGCELQSATIEGAYWEGAAPVQIVGDGVQINGGRHFLLPRGIVGFTIKQGVAGSLTFNGVHFYREENVGASDNSPLIDCSGASNFDISFNNTKSSEWAWRQANGNASLVRRGGSTVVRYSNHRLSITAADKNIYILNSIPYENLLRADQFDHMGYTTAGWTLTPASTGAVLSNTSSAGPPNYLPSQLTLKGSGPAVASSGNPTNLSTLQHSMLRVRPGEVYWISAWIKVASGKRSAFIASFYTISGASILSDEIADQAYIGSNVWTFCEGPTAVPVDAAYMAVGVSLQSVAEVLFTDVTVRRA
jgi:hypothetical protein